MAAAGVDQAFVFLWISLDLGSDLLQIMIFAVFCFGPSI